MNHQQPTYTQLGDDWTSPEKHIWVSTNSICDRSVFEDDISQYGPFWAFHRISIISLSKHHLLSLENLSCHIPAYFFKQHFCNLKARLSYNCSAFSRLIFAFFNTIHRQINGDLYCHQCVCLRCTLVHELRNYSKIMMLCNGSLKAKVKYGT